MNMQAAGKAMEVLTTCKKLVKPSTPTPCHRQKFKLSSFDQLQLPRYVELTFHYHADNGVETTSARICRLEESLSQTLSLFNHMAGRYGAKGNDFAIDCNDEGIEFVEARVNHEIDHLILEEDQERCLEMLLALPRNLAVVPGSSLPLVAVQVNVFECGGLAISVQISHITGDMWSMSMFMDAWATASCRGITADAVLPSFDLASLFPPREELGRVFGSAFVKDDRMVPPGKHNLTMKRFVFRGEDLSRLRADTTTDISPGRTSDNKNQPSRVVLVSALICRALMRVDLAKYGRSRPTAVVHPINLRGRTNLNVPENSFGNFFANTNETQLMTRMENGPQPLPALVDWIRSTMGNAIDEFGKVEDCKELSTKVENSAKAFLEVLLKGETNLIIISSWCRFPIYGVDYGWGRPSSVSTTKAWLDNLINLTDTEGGDGIEAWVNLEYDDMRQFESDRDVLTYTHRS